MSNYKIHASPFFYDVTCPKHRNLMKELDNGLIGEKTWWCDVCKKPYQLKPIAMRTGTYSQQKIDEQLKEVINE